MKNHRTLVTPPTRGRRLRCTVPLLRGAASLSGGAKGIGTSPGAVAPDDRSRSPFPDGKSLGTSGPGHHAAVGRPIGECLVIDVADRTAGATTIVCLLITIQRVR